jgi:hypothetical protein
MYMQIMKDHGIANPNERYKLPYTIPQLPSSIEEACKQMAANPLLGNKYGNTTPRGLTPKGLTVAESFDLKTSARVRVEVEQEGDE